jgi:hypothetical protein
MAATLIFCGSIQPKQRLLRQLQTEQLPNQQRPQLHRLRSRAHQHQRNVRRQ